MATSSPQQHIFPKKSKVVVTPLTPPEPKEAPTETEDEVPAAGRPRARTVKGASDASAV